MIVLRFLNHPVINVIGVGDSAVGRLNLNHTPGLVIGIANGVIDRI